MFSLYIACSQDYFIADIHGSVDFLTPFEHQGADYGYSDYYDGVDMVCMGRHTYEAVRLLADTWPYAEKPTILYTHREIKPVHESITIKQWPLATIAHEYTDKKIWLVGGAHMTMQALDEWVLDEVIMTIVPQKLFDGIHMFGWAENPFEAGRYKHEELAYPGGVRQIVYKRSLYS